MEQLTAMDASFLYTETPSSPMHIGALSIYDPSTVEGGKQRFKDILAFIEERLHLASTFRRKMVQVPFNLDHPYWIEDEDFDIEFHVRHIRLPEPGDFGPGVVQEQEVGSLALKRTGTIQHPEQYDLQVHHRFDACLPRCGQGTNRDGVFVR